MEAFGSSYGELESRLDKAGAVLAALRSLGFEGLPESQPALLARLQEVESALKEARAELDQNVRRYGRELFEANERLRQEIAARTQVEESLRRAHEALLSRERILNDTGRIARIGGWEHDLETGQAIWTPALYEIIGIESGPPPGPNEHLDYYPPKDREILAAAYTRALETGESFDLELRCTTAAGREIWARVQGMPEYRDGKCVKMRGTFQDITDRKQADETLRLTQYMVDRASLGIFRVAPDGKIVSVNEHACRTLGYSREELLQMTVLDIDPTFTQEQWLEHRERIRNSPTGTFESTHRCKDGTLIPVEITINFGQYEGKELSVSFVRDISERRYAEAERAQLQAQLVQAQKLEAVGQLAGGVAHDFNNILTAVLGNVELARAALDGKAPSMEHLHDALNQIELGADRAATLTRQLLAFSRRQISKPVALDLNATLLDMEKMLRRLIAENISLDVNVADGLHVVFADRGQIEQVIMNLVVNARDAMPEGGRLTLATANVTLDEEYAATRPGVHPGEHVMLSISDTGQGMDEATRLRIFEPFFTTKDLTQGTGLGLAMVYGIVKQSSGHIAVYSEPGRGTTFRIYLPAIDRPADVFRPPAERATPGGSETILICEDDDSVRSLAAGMLRVAGYTVIAGRDGRDTITLAGQHAGPINLLVTDVIMPDMDGKALSMAIKSRWPDIGVLFVSGYTSDVIVHHGVLESGVDFLEKPFTRGMLLESVRQILDRTGTSKK